MTDTASFEHAKVGEVKEGDVLVADVGFTCIDEGELLAVNKDSDGQLWVHCDHERHYLDGQIAYHSEGPIYIGLRKYGNAPR